VAGSLRSGFSLQQSLAAAQENGSGPLAEELGKALAASRIGATLEDELEKIAGRMRSEDWRMTVMAIRIQRAVGGNLAEVLAGTARTLRERSSVRRHVKALSAEGRLSAYILIALPFAVFGILFVIRREYLVPLWSTLPGVGCLLLAALLLAVGIRWVLAVSKVEV
jgi:tight adherence protein B